MHYSFLVAFLDLPVGYQQHLLLVVTSQDVSQHCQIALVENHGSNYRQTSEILLIQFQTTAIKSPEISNPHLLHLLHWSGFKEEINIQRLQANGEGNAMEFDERVATGQLLAMVFHPQCASESPKAL